MIIFKGSPHVYLTNTVKDPANISFTVKGLCPTGYNSLDAAFVDALISGQTKEANL